MNFRTFCFLSLVALSGCIALPTLSAQNNAVVPNANATTEGPLGGGAAVFFGNVSATLQYYLHRSQLANFSTGDQINGLSVRRDGGDPTLAGAISYTQYDIEISESDAASFAAGLFASTNFATNQGSTPVLVRSGALTVPAGSLVGGSTPNPFSYVLPFTTPYTYTANTDIVITIRMSGHTGSVSAVDAVADDQAGLIDWLGTSGSATATDATATTFRATVFELISEPEFDLLGCATPVTNGGTLSPGTQGSAGIPITQAVTIENNGVEDLTITIPVAAPGSLTNCSAAITSQPAATVIAGSFTTIYVEITPTAGGVYSCTVSISSNDRDEDPYVFTIDGTAAAAAPEMDVLRSAVPIADAGTDAVGDVDFGITQTLTYTIENNGSAALNLNGTPAVSVTPGTNITSASVTAQPAISVAASGSTTFTVSYTITAAGAWDIAVSIDNDDSNEDPYNWTISGTSTTQGSTGGGGGDGDDEDGCVAGTGNFGWIALLAILSLLGLAKRLRTARE